MKTVLVVAAVDPLARDTVSVSLTADVPDLTVIRLDMDPARPGEVRRSITSGDHSVESGWVVPDDPCPTCGLADVTVDSAAAGPPGAVALVLPTGAATIGVTRRLVKALATGEQLSGAHFAGVATVCDVATFEEDLLGDDLLRERGHHLFEGDDRSVGEALAATVEHTDFVLTMGGGSERSSGLLDHLRAADSHRLDELTHHDLTRLFDHAHHPSTAERRVDPLIVPSHPRSSVSGAWRMTLSTDRAFHPQRLYEKLSDLGAGRFRSRGHFWLPTRPFTACAWDGAGGQLSIGPLGDWKERRPGTRLSFVGVGAGREDVVEAFDAAVVTPDEETADWTTWLDVTDQFDPWLGDRR